MGDPDRIDRRRLLAAEPAVRAHAPDVADELVLQVDCFLTAAAAHAASTAYRVRLRDSTALPHADLVAALLRAGDVLRLADDPDGLGCWCVALAARLGTVLEDLDPTVVRALVFIEDDGTLVLVPFDPDDLDDIPGFADEPAP